MTDITLSNKATTTTVNGAYYYVIIPDGASPTGFVGKRIKHLDLLAGVNADIESNGDRLTVNEADILELQNSSSKRLDKSQTGDYSYTQAADSIIDEIYFIGAGIVSVGTTLAGEDIASSRAIEGGIRKINVNASDGYTDTNRTIYISISGVVEVVIYSKLKLIT